MKTAIALAASLLLFGAVLALLPAPRAPRWAELQLSWSPESTAFVGARVVGRFESSAGCKREIWPPSFITTGRHTVFARFQCVSTK